MTEKDDREQRKAELLWKYVEELKQAESPEDVQFVAITNGECAEVVGIMETASEAYALVRAKAAPHCRREAIRQRLRAAIADAAPSAPRPAAPATAVRSLTLPAWLTAPLTVRSTGWVVAVAALLAVGWLSLPRPSGEIVPMSHRAAVAAIPRLIEGQLDDESTRALWAHIARCRACMELYRTDLKAARSAPLRQSRRPPVPDTGVRTPPAVVWSAMPGYVWVASTPSPR